MAEYYYENGEYHRVHRNHRRLSWRTPFHLWDEVLISIGGLYERLGGR